MSNNTSGVTPVTREEQYLSYIAGESSTKPDKPVTRMEKLLNAIAEGGGTGGGGAQANLEQNDPFAPDYVKGRTHYSEYEAVLPEMALLYDAKFEFYAARSDSLPVLESSKEYRITYDGAHYICSPLVGDGVALIGNLALVGQGSDTGEPFILSISPSDNLIGAMTKTGEYNDSAVIKIESIIITKLPKEYYDYGTFYVDIAVESVDGTDTYSTNVTYGEMQEALNSGKTVVARVMEIYDNDDEIPVYVPFFLNLAVVTGYRLGRYIPALVVFTGITFTGNTARLMLNAGGDPTADTKYSVEFREYT